MCDEREPHSGQEFNDADGQGSTSGRRAAEGKAGGTVSSEECSLVVNTKHLSVFYLLTNGKPLRAFEQMAV